MTMGARIIITEEIDVFEGHKGISRWNGLYCGNMHGLRLTPLLETIRIERTLEDRTGRNVRGDPTHVPFPLEFIHANEYEPRVADQGESASISIEEPALPAEFSVPVQPTTASVDRRLQGEDAAGKRDSMIRRSSPTTQQAKGEQS